MSSQPNLQGADPAMQGLQIQPQCIDPLDGLGGSEFPRSAGNTGAQATQGCDVSDKGRNACRREQKRGTAGNRCRQTDPEDRIVNRTRAQGIQSSLEFAINLNNLGTDRLVVFFQPVIGWVRPAMALEPVQEYLILGKVQGRQRLDRTVLVLAVVVEIVPIGEAVAHGSAFSFQPFRLHQCTLTPQADPRPDHDECRNTKQRTKCRDLVGGDP